MPETRPVFRIEALDLSVQSYDWAFAREHRREIDAHFEAQRKDKPSLWNGRVLLMHRHELEGAVLRGAYFETDFASFIAWRDLGFPDHSVRNCFALGALQGSDGGYVMGVMGAHTVNAGKIYFPGGTPDPSDVFDGKVDLDSSVRREVREETGLDPADFDIDAGWHCVPAGPLLALLKPMRARDKTADRLRAQIEAHIRGEAAPELAGAMVARGPADIHPDMQPFMQTFLRSRWP